MIPAVSTHTVSARLSDTRKRVTQFQCRMTLPDWPIEVQDDTGAFARSDGHFLWRFDLTRIQVSDKGYGTVATVPV